MRFPWSFSYGVRIFNFLLQTNGINCAWNWSRWFGGPKSCLLCGAATESTAHVLNRCPGRLPIYRSRHDAALKVFTRRLITFPEKYHVLIDQTCRYTQDTLRPDVQAYREYTTKWGDDVRLARLSDMKCPWPRENYVDRTHTANVEKYANLTLQVQGYYPDTTMDTIIVPTVGPMPAHTQVALAKLFGAKEATKLCCNMSAAVARENYKLRSTLRMKPPNGASPRRGPPVPVPVEEDIEPMHEVMPPGGGEQDLDPRDAQERPIPPADPDPPILVLTLVGTGVPPDGQRTD
jgi:hypothetical protein